MFLRALFVITLLALAIPAQAAEEEDQSPWAGKALLGYLATSGNTDNSNLNSAFEISYTRDVWMHMFKASAIHATAKMETRQRQQRPTLQDGRANADCPSITTCLVSWIGARIVSVGTTPSSRRRWATAAG